MRTPRARVGEQANILHRRHCFACGSPSEILLTVLRFARGIGTPSRFVNCSHSDRRMRTHSHDQHPSPVRDHRGITAPDTWPGARVRIRFRPDRAARADLLVGIRGQALGLPVAKDGAVDAFNLVPPSWLGVILIVIGGGLSFWAIYRLSGTLARWWSEPGRAGRG